MPPPITISSPLPADDLLFASMTASAGLSMLGDMRLELLSLKPDLKPEDLLGKPVTVKVQLRVDSQSAHDAAPSCPSLPYIEQGADTSPDTECISDWSFSREVRSGKVALTSYDFERPSTDLKVKADKARQYSLSDYEVFDFQG